MLFFFKFNVEKKHLKRSLNADMTNHLCLTELGFLKFFSVK